jgi:hypothetical protein
VIDVEQAERERPALAAEDQAKAADPPRSPASRQHDGAPIVADTPDGHAASLAYYELRGVDNLPNTQRDYNDAKRGLEPSAERDAREQRDNPPRPASPTAIKHVAFPPKRDNDHIVPARRLVRGNRRKTLWRRLNGLERAEAERPRRFGGRRAPTASNAIRGST